jgi:hypothetical protein
MANGRCRLHEGLSTGPRTPGEIERIRRTTTKHGYYSAAEIAERRRLRMLLRQSRTLVEQLKSGSQGGTEE